MDAPVRYFFVQHSQIFFAHIQIIAINVPGNIKRALASYTNSLG